MVTWARARCWSSRARTTSGFCLSAISRASRRVSVRTSAAACRLNSKKTTRAFMAPVSQKRLGRLLVGMLHHAAHAAEFLAQFTFAQGDQDDVDEHDHPRCAEAEEHELDVAIQPFLQIIARVPSCEGYRFHGRKIPGASAPSPGSPRSRPGPAGSSKWGLPCRAPCRLRRGWKAPAADAACSTTRWICRKCRRSRCPAR